MFEKYSEDSYWWLYDGREIEEEEDRVRCEMDVEDNVCLHVLRKDGSCGNKGKHI